MCVSVVVFGFLVLNICICICISCGFKPSLKILFELIPLNFFELIPFNSFGTYITAWQLKPVSAIWTVPCLCVLLSSWIHCRFAKLNPFVSTLHCGHDVGHFVVETFQCDFVRNEASEIHWYKQTNFRHLINFYRTLGFFLAFQSQRNEFHTHCSLPR